MLMSTETLRGLSSFPFFTGRSRLVRWISICVCGLLAVEAVTRWQYHSSTASLFDDIPMPETLARLGPGRMYQKFGTGAGAESNPHDYIEPDTALHHHHFASSLESGSALNLAGKVVVDTRDDPPLCFGSSGESKVHLDAQWTICPECKDSKKGGFLRKSATSDHASSSDRLLSSNVSKEEVFQHILQNVLLKSNFEAVFLPPSVRNQLFERYLSNPDTLLSFSFRLLHAGVPTLYMYTRTADSGRLKGATRRRYMQRHVQLIHNYTEAVKIQGYGDGQSYEDVQRQLLWIVVEDAPHIDAELDKLLRTADVPYIYFAHGPTNRWGKAQWNIVLKLIDVLTHTLFGDGPIVNVDDDAYFMPEVLRRMWKVKRMIAWQAGNFPLYRDFAPSEWEGPFYENGKLVRWHYGGRPERKIRIDMNAFAINSTMVGEGRPVHGPQYVPHNNPAGESEFVEMIVDTEESIEPLCENTREEKCYWVWHNHWMPEDWDEMHKPPTKPDY